MRHSTLCALALAASAAPLGAQGKPSRSALVPGAVAITDVTIIPMTGEIELNAGRATITLVVANSGDRPVQVGSHYHFAETNDALVFGRAAARGFRLNIPAGTAVRFEPGQTRTVELVAYGGDRIVIGFQARTDGAL